MSDENKALAQSTTSSKWGLIVLFILILIVTLLASYDYLLLTRKETSLTKKIGTLEASIVNSQRSIETIQQSLEQLTANLQKSQELSDKQEKILANWQSVQEGNLDNWHIAEAQHLVKLANDHTQLTNGRSISIALLQRAQEALQNVKTADIAAIQSSLITDLNNLQNANQPEINDLYKQLSELDKQLDQLSLPIMQNKQEPASSSNESKPEQSWWQKGLDRSWQMLSQIVIVHNNGSNALPLIIPQEKIFLYQNLHSQIENAMWGLLHQNTVVYQTSLFRAIDWIKKYFVQDNELTQTLLKNLQSLASENILSPTINLATTLQQFDNYFADKKIHPLPLMQQGTQQ